MCMPGGAWGPQFTLNFRDTHRTDFVISINTTHNVFHTVFVDPSRAAALYPFTVGTHIIFVTSKTGTTCVRVDIVYC